ncbi:hemolysin XhlA family protein [Paraclostridium bifermentans]
MDILDFHEKRINNHVEIIDKLEQRDVKIDVQIENLCKRIEGITTLIKWYLGLFEEVLLCSLFYAI